jgi:hypothetical protein
MNRPGSALSKAITKTTTSGVQIPVRKVNKSP